MKAKPASKRFTRADARARAAQVQRGRANHKKGDKAEEQVMRLMRTMGFKCCRLIHTGWRIHRVGGKIVSATPKAAVVGDIAAIMPGGRSVLVEVKNRPERLSYGDIEEHQHEALTEHRNNGGLSLIAWKCTHGLSLMLYRDACIGDDAPMRPGKRLQWSEAQELHMSGKIKVVD